MAYFGFPFCRYAASVGAKHFHTSAKLNKGIEEMFLDLSKSESAQTRYYENIFIITECHYNCPVVLAPIG